MERENSSQDIRERELGKETSVKLAEVNGKLFK